MDGKEMRLSDLKGKVVYIDFWSHSSWACLTDIPAAKKMEGLYKGKDIVFVYVSVDDNEASWKRATERMQLSGINTCDCGGWDGTIAKQYDLQAVPAHFLINKKGRYAVDIAPAPTDEMNFTTTVNKLLRER